MLKVFTFSERIDLADWLTRGMLVMETRVVHGVSYTEVFNRWGPCRLSNLPPYEPFTQAWFFELLHMLCLTLYIVTQVIPKIYACCNNFFFVLFLSSILLENCNMKTRWTKIYLLVSQNNQSFEAPNIPMLWSSSTKASMSFTDMHIFLQVFWDSLNTCHWSCWSYLQGILLLLTPFLDWSIHKKISSWCSPLQTLEWALTVYTISSLYP